MMLDGSDLAFVIPLWRRTTNIERVTDAIRLSTPAATIVFVVSDLDGGPMCAVAELCAHDMMERMETGEHGHAGWIYPVVVPGEGGERGDYARKINAGYRATDAPFIFTGADDIIPHYGWYDAARALMVDRVGVVGTVDQNNGRTANGTHSTHSLVARWYADEGACADQDHVIYHEGYWHEYCDDELVRTAMQRNAYAHAFDAIVEHRHWHGDKTRDDPTYRHGRAHTGLSRRLFMQRRVLWGEMPRGGMPRQRAPRVVRRSR